MLTTFHMLRQQKERDGQLLCLADYVAPKSEGRADHLGAFAVGVHGATALAEGLEADGDDYGAILLKAVADRLAEGAAEWLHEKVRTELWATSPDEALSNEEIIRMRYRGIRPAPGYPACPDHTEKRALWRLLEVHERTGLQLTENLAMQPASAVCGWYFAHPQARYFGVGALGRDQVVDYARRKGMSVEEAERWLAPNLGYEPDNVRNVDQLN